MNMRAENEERTFIFTQEKLNALSLPPKGARAYYRDAKEAGLMIDVRSSGSKSFYLYKKIDGKPERIFLGLYPDMKIPEARKLASVKKGQIANGINPQEEKRKIREEMTFRELFNEYMTRYSRVEKKSWKYDEREVNKYLSHWFQRKISSFKKYEIQKLHEQLRVNNGLYQANRILERLRSMFNKAIEWGWDKPNPTNGIKKFKEKTRDRFIQSNELPLFLQAVYEEENQTARDYILISLMTGARKSNVLSMRWEQVSWEQSLWRIPDTKNGEPVTVPLIPKAIEILYRRKQSSTSSWVFEGEGREGHFADPKKSWDRIRLKATLALWCQSPVLSEIIDEVEKRLRAQNNYGFTSLKLVREAIKEFERRKVDFPQGLMDLRLHDIRRTLGSYQAISGASLAIIGKSLGHKSQQSTAIYARLDLDPVRASIERANSLMFSVVDAVKEPLLLLASEK